MSAEEDQHYDFSDRGEVLFIDKPLNWTSFDVIKQVRLLFEIKKVGHAGTLDPKASGLLIVCTGKKTKSIDQFVALEKEYTGTFEIGIRTPSFDMETAIHEVSDVSSITEEQILQTAKSFQGKQIQMPPMYSAIKYGGKPLYQYARNGQTVERTGREIDIVKFEITGIRIPYVDFCVVCSKGTYIRSLADDFGDRIGCGAALTALRRVRIGEHHIENAMNMAGLLDLSNLILKKAQNNSEINPAH
jgi:tRNA pseudouridine55 synthase